MTLEDFLVGIHYPDIICVWFIMWHFTKEIKRSIEKTGK